MHYKLYPYLQYELTEYAEDNSVNYDKYVSKVVIKHYAIGKL